MKLAGLISLANPIINILCIVVNVYCEVNYIKNIAIYVIQTYKVIGDDSLVERKKRDYKKEYREYGGKPEHIKERSERNKARRMMGLKVGDPREVDHIKPLSKGGSNSKRNLRVVSRKTNRKKGAKYNGGGGKYKGGKRIK